MNEPVMNQSGVYGLVDSRKPFKIKYVGKTIRSFWERQREHRQKTHSGSPQLRDWILSVYESGGQVDLVPLEALLEGPELKKAEQQWIAWAKLFGPTLNLEQGDLNGKNRYNKEFV